ncbi:hypothetical protein [Halomonas salipaludis]|uniref:Uncharacterized protein n=1 Tax=Halomonas salipaludis TaxID=2032625 RepID=A0A2A2F3N6_9GAMM|nr:hypothetical protein [Halomonas salipaludis]PAU79222.1 hypothetical protein CK498_02305 [Halomonas salipaludis]
MTRLVIGRPAVGGMGANQKAKEAFSGAEFPLTVNVANKMTITLSLPEAGIKLRPLASGVATFRDYDRLQRAVSSLEQIARLNNAAQLVILEAAEPSAEEAKAAAEPAPEGDAGETGDTSGSGDGDSAGGDGTEQTPEGGVEVAVTIVQDDEQAFVVELDGVRFEPLRNQVREDGTLTAGGLKAFEEAKAAAGADD